MQQALLPSVGAVKKTRCPADDSKRSTKSDAVNSWKTNIDHPNSISQFHKRSSKSEALTPRTFHEMTRRMFLQGFSSTCWSDHLPNVILLMMFTRSSKSKPTQLRVATFSPLTHFPSSLENSIRRTGRLSVEILV